MGNSLGDVTQINPGSKRAARAGPERLHRNKPLAWDTPGGLDALCLVRHNLSALTLRTALREALQVLTASTASASKPDTTPHNVLSHPT